MSSTSKIDLATEAVITLINAMDNFATMTRGALGTGNGLCCEIAPSVYSAVYLDKSTYTPLTLAINGKHTDLQVLTNTLNDITHTLSRMTEYPTGDGWQIVDITSGNLPRVIGREPNNAWLMASDIIVKVHT